MKCEQLNKQIRRNNFWFRVAHHCHRIVLLDGSFVGDSLVLQFDSFKFVDRRLRIKS